MLDLPKFFTRRNSKRISEDYAFEYLFEHYSNPVYIMDRDLHIIKRNRAFEELLQMKPGHVDDVLKTLRPYRQIYQIRGFYEEALKGRIQNYQTRNIINTSQSLELEHRVVPMFSGEKVTGLIGMMRDITQFKKQDKELTRFLVGIKAMENLVDMGIWEYDIIDDRAYFSDKMYDIFQLKRDKTPTYKNVFQLVHPEDKDIFMGAFERSAEEGIPMKIKYRIVCPNGEEKLLHQYTDVILNDSQKVVKLIISTYAVNEGHQEVHNNKNSTDHSKVYQHMEAYIWARDAKSNKLLSCSQGVKSITGYTAKEFLHGEVSWDELIYKDDILDYQAARSNVQKPEFVLEYRIIDKSGKMKWVQDKTIVITDEAGDVVRLEGVVIDITERKQDRERIEFLKYHDPLTGLPNHRKFDKEFSRLLNNKNEEFAIMKIDMDGFKRINSALNHNTGDKLLKEFASRLSKFILGGDLVCRLGSDEFTVLLRQIQGKKHVEMIADQMVENLNKPYYIDGHELFITASMGIAYYPEDGKNMRDLFSRAEEALRRTKQAGKASYLLYSPYMDIESSRQFKLERDLRKAIEQKHLFMYYQPIVDPDTNQMLRAEALLRWDHPDWKLVSPNEFVLLAEDNGFIDGLTHWTFKEVCSQIAEWKKKDLPLVPVSINVSPKSLMKSSWVDSLFGAITEAGIDPSMIELEITENVLLDNHEGFQQDMEKLIRAGVRFALDDFGTGYSSLLYLRKFQMDSIKIDHTFISEQISSKDSAITKAIIDLSHELGIKVIAEGVETEEQLLFLKENGCDQIQGYLYERPLPHTDFEKLLVHPILPINIPNNNSQIDKKKQSNGWSYPLQAGLTVSKIKDKTINVGYTQVMIHNIRKDGLRFSSTLNLPVSDFQLKLEVQIEEKIFTLFGSIVWKENMWKDNFKYDVIFTSETIQDDSVSELLGRLDL
ncbi:EAL domain-containing protein [Siminovitchia sediminis]|uniref:EAL domain-containing protein n=1 Tax=Siminovitchia sediminis TaxID=1274353 RepID=A0ABW4KM66_9BACI